MSYYHRRIFVKILFFILFPFITIASLHSQEKKDNDDNYFSKSESIFDKLITSIDKDNNFRKEIEHNNKQYKNEYKKVYSEFSQKVRSGDEKEIDKLKDYIRKQMIENKTAPENLLSLLGARAPQKYKNGIHQYFKQLLEDKLVPYQKIRILWSMIVNYYKNKNHSKKQAHFIINQLKKCYNKIPILEKRFTIMHLSIHGKGGKLDPLWFYGISLIYANISNLNNNRQDNARLLKYLEELHFEGAISKNNFKDNLLLLTKEKNIDNYLIKSYIKNHEDLFNPEELKQLKQNSILTGD